MNRKKLIETIKLKNSFLCIGLDSDISKIPSHLLDYEDPIFEFNKLIIDSTLPYAVAYKPNLAFYESRGINGLMSLHKTMKYLDKYKNQVFTIADAKRGDIGNTSLQYAKAFFENDLNGYSFDSVTVAPYMGEDSVSPFLSYPDKWAIILALTSNKGANDFQMINDTEETALFKAVLQKSANWGTKENIMYVVGATQAAMLTEIRKIVPEHFLLVPGIGAQGGSLQEVAKYGLNADCGLIVNSSRGIIFASKGKDFDKVAEIEARKVQIEMKGVLERIF